MGLYSRTYLAPHLPANKFINYRRAVQFQAQIRDFADGIDVQPETFMYVWGPSGVGKSQLVHWTFTDAELKRQTTNKQHTWDVVHSRAPAGGAQKGYFTDLVKELGGLPRGSVDIMIAQAKRHLHDLGTKLLIIDEVQHFARGGEFGVADRIKDMVDTFAPCRILLVGTHDLLHLITSNDQLEGRVMDSITLKPFDWFDADDQADYRDALETIRLSDPKLFSAVNINSEGLAGALHLASRGLLRPTTRLLTVAKRFARYAGRTAITVPDLAAAFAKFTERQVNPEDNPFLMKELPEHWLPVDLTHGVDRGKAGRRLERNSSPAA